MSIAFRYDAHDTEIISDLALPELTPSQRDRPHRSIEIFEENSLPFPAGKGERWWVDPAGFQITWDGVAVFRVTPTGDISYRRYPTASDELIRVPLLGSVLAVALYFLGRLVLHGNAMCIEGKGALLLGAKGQGKSTLSAALVARGHAIQAEDVATVAGSSGGAVEIFRGMRQLRLWPDAIRPSLGEPSLPSRPIHEWSDKRVFPLADQAATLAPLSLASIYILVDADTIEFQTLPTASAWPLILVHAFVSRFGTRFLTGPDAARHFAACAALSRAVRCVRLRRPRDFSRLGEVCARIEQDLPWA